MKKPHWEYITSKFPSLNTEVRFHDAPKDVGIFARLGALSSYLEDMEKKGNVITSVDGYSIQHRIAAQFLVFATDGAKVYKIARQFGEDLAEVKLNIPCAHLPITNKIICFEFPDHMRFHLGDGKYAHCVYVFSTNERDLPESPEEGIRKGYLQMLIPLYDDKGHIDPRQEVQEFGVTIYDYTVNIDVAIKTALDRSEYKFSNRKFIDFVINCMVYLESGDPDLREYNAPKPPQTNKAKKLRLWHRQHENQCTINMTLVGYDWKKPCEYREGETMRRGHPRWQPYGSKREKVKLIWIEPTVVHYKVAALVAQPPKEGEGGEGVQ